MQENTRKRQTWELSQEVEHLGLRGAPATAHPLALRDGWDAIQENFRLLSRLPGGLHIREEAARLFFKPKWLWPAPLLEVAPRRLVHELRKALLNYTDCSWWCQARFWADRIDIHPVYGAAVNSALAALRLGVPVSAIARTALSTHLRELGLCIASWDQRGLFLSPLSEDLCFRKTLRPYFSHRRANKPALKCDTEKGAHALRLAARYRCLQETKLTRYDSEGINDVDVDASSQPYWATWRKRLDARQMLLLAIYRGGAASTPTRRQAMPQNSTRCPFCDRPQASMRHFWAECPAFEPTRQNLMRQFAIPVGWFQEQPRVTAKSGWVTFSASPCKAKRAKLQVAACELGMEVLQRANVFHPVRGSGIDLDALLREA